MAKAVEAGIFFIASETGDDAVEGRLEAFVYAAAVAKAGRRCIRIGPQIRRGQRVAGAGAGH